LNADMHMHPYVCMSIITAAPIITSRPRDAQVTEGLYMEFTCVASGHPYPEITWWNNNRLVNSDGRVEVSNGGQHLRIEDTKPYDSGSYVCRAQNRLGTTEETVKLKVKHKPMPVQLITIPHDMVAQKGTTIQMPCRALGSPTPTIKWLKDGQDMTDSRFNVRPDGSLIVQNVTEADEGMYECVAENGIDKKTAQARFSVRATREVPVVSAYKTGRPAAGDDFVLVALEEAILEVNKALNSTVERLFSGQKSLTSSTPSELIRIFRYPPVSDRQVARAAEIYERTLELVAKKTYGSNEDWKKQSSNFSYTDLVSPGNLELIANLSGCEAHRAKRDLKCTQDMCFHAKYRAIDGTCNNFQTPFWGASMTTFKRLLPPRYENNFNTPNGNKINHVAPKLPKKTFSFRLGQR
jgi:peroxidase